AVDPHLCVQSESDLSADSGCGNAAGAEKPRSGRICGAYLVANRFTNAPAGRHGRSTSSAPSKSSLRTRLPSVASLPKNRRLHHGVLVEVLADAGVRRIYGLSGDSLNGITDSIRATNSLQWVHVRHEETAAFAAGAEAHLTGTLAVCAGSCGPGNLHLINGLY